MTNPVSPAETPVLTGHTLAETFETLQSPAPLDPTDVIGAIQRRLQVATVTEKVAGELVYRAQQQAEDARTTVVGVSQELDVAYAAFSDALAREQWQADEPLALADVVQRYADVGRTTIDYFVRRAAQSPVWGVTPGTLFAVAEQGRGGQQVFKAGVAASRPALVMNGSAALEFQVQTEGATGTDGTPGETEVVTLPAAAADDGVQLIGQGAMPTYIGEKFAGKAKLSDLSTMLALRESLLSVQHEAVEGAVYALNWAIGGLADKVYVLEWDGEYVGGAYVREDTGRPRDWKRLFGTLETEHPETYRQLCDQIVLGSVLDERTTNAATALKAYLAEKISGHEAAKPREDVDDVSELVAQLDTEARLQSLRVEWTQRAAELLRQTQTQPE
jgi:post-segregation antitoxin (ccd killing protein)